ncbi:alpha/beta fold hydrolase [bacterium]|nr:alpha/beta fold hydrolase [bacterium]
MNTNKLFQKGNNLKIIAVFLISFFVFVLAVFIAHLMQTDFGRIEVSNVTYKNYNGKNIRAKLFRPLTANVHNHLPGVVFIHGYQNNRESGDAYNIELAKRGFVVLGIDAIGRGNSDTPFDLEDARFDSTFGARTSVSYLRSLPFVDQTSVGIMGHSMGAKFAYEVALEDPTIQSVIIIGSAYDERVSKTAPRNMLMIIGELDEFRDFFTKTKDITREWMSTRSTLNAFPDDQPRFNTLYGNFSEGTARKVFKIRISHIQESHNKACIAEALRWMKDSLGPPKALWKDPFDQSWPIKEAMTLLAMLACFICTMPLALLLLKTTLFQSIRGPINSRYSASTGEYLKGTAINGVFMWLYLPLIMTLFAVHKFLIPVDSVFPMLLVDAIVWWFVWINIFGLIVIRRWYKKRGGSSGVTLYDLGLSYSKGRFSLGRERVLKTILLGLILFSFLYIFEVLSETFFLVDFRFIYPLVSDLTPYRVLMFLIYFPFILFGFFVLTIFIHGQIRRLRKKTWLKTYFFWTGSNILALVTPLILFLLVQYIPLLSTGFIPFEGPGGVFVVFILELFFIMLTLTIVMVLSTWFFQITGKIYLSALMNALIVTWLFASSQVIAPIP